jgi:hypothetical protein
MRGDGFFRDWKRDAHRISFTGALRHLGTWIEIAAVACAPCGFSLSDAGFGALLVAADCRLLHGVGPWGGLAATCHRRRTQALLRVTPLLPLRRSAARAVLDGWELRGRGERAPLTHRGSPGAAFLARTGCSRR